MARQIITIGHNPNDGEGETLRSGAVKINENFAELYAALNIGNDTTFVNSIIPGNGISVTPNSGTGAVTIVNTKPYVSSFTALAVPGQTAFAANANNQTLNLVAGTNITLTTSPIAASVTIAATQQNSDWDALTGPTRILNKPSIPAAQIQSDWNQTSQSFPDYIKNKPTVATDISQLTDTTGKLATNYRIVSLSNFVPPSSSQVIYSAGAAVNSVKLCLRAVGTTGGTEQHQQAMEALIVRSFPLSGNPTIQITTCASVYTGLSALFSVSATWNASTSKIDVTVTNTHGGTNDTLTAVVYATEYL